MIVLSAQSLTQPRPEVAFFLGGEDVFEIAITRPDVFHGEHGSAGPRFGGIAAAMPWALL